MYASGTCFATISARAPFAPRVEQLASRSIRDAILHPRGSRIERKLEPATPGRCEFHVGNETNLSFSEKNRNEVNVTNPSHHKRVTLCAQVTKLYVLVLFGEPQIVPSGPIEDGFGTPRWTRFRDNPQRSVLIAAHCGVPTIGFPLGKLMIPWFEADKRCRRAVRRRKNAHRDPSPAVEQQRSTEIERCLTSLVALNEPRAGIVLLVQPLLWF